MAAPEFVLMVRKELFKALLTVTVDSVREALTFQAVMRGMSLLLAFLALVLSVVFVFVLAHGSVKLSDGLTFVGLLLTAAAFFANAGAGSREPSKPSGSSVAKTPITDD